MQFHSKSDSGPPAYVGRHLNFRCKNVTSIARVHDYRT
jgi:hypothetical protein